MENEGVTLPADFQFSQGSLQDYVDCPRRFQLRYIQRLAWPAVEAEPALENERHLQQGAAFHRLVHQHLLGLSPERLSSTITDEDLSRWWHNYLESGPADLLASRYPEVILSAPVSGHRLVAKYDLIAVDPVLSKVEREVEGSGQRADFGEPLGLSSGRRLSRAVILEWKTSCKRPRRKWLAERLQTRVYPYLLVRAGSHLLEIGDWRLEIGNWRSFQPEQIEMVYWFANFPDDPERFAYDIAQYDADDDYLASLVEEIKSLADEDFPLTTQERRCRYCPYRSLCQRGVRAGALDEAEDEPEWGDDFEIALDFEQIAEIEY
ncbi:MAG: PD-(D/E)XK nuclease family protein [Anaerolineales bacterium]|nr:MAG: PD-(D/E)XK nuclease family protein [Anaerolineales bacterium]